MTRLAAISMSLIALFALSACETFEGAGRDISSGGAAVSETAREVQADL